VKKCWQLFTTPAHPIFMILTNPLQKLSTNSCALPLWHNYEAGGPVASGIESGANRKVANWLTINYADKIFRRYWHWQV
jgi:hypothetical protein